MEGRRVNHQAQQRNPLYVLFLCLLAAVFVLAVIAIVLGAKLTSAQKALSRAQTQVEELKAQLREADEQQSEPSGETEPQPGSPDETSPGQPADTQPTEPDPTPAEPSTPTPDASSTSWLDLNTITGVSVKPSALLDKFYPYYTTDTLNLRSGPGTNYDRIVSVEKGEQVDVAARQGSWMFVRVGSRYGWMNADYLSTSKPASQTAPAPSGNGSGSGSGNNSGSGSGSGSGRGSEATSGSLNRR